MSFIFNSPAGAQDRRKQAIIAQIMGQGAPNPATPAVGAVNGLNSIANGFRLRQMNNAAPPAGQPGAPLDITAGGNQPGLWQGLMGLFGGGS